MRLMTDRRHPELGIAGRLESLDVLDERAEQRIRKMSSWQTGVERAMASASSGNLQTLTNDYSDSHPRACSVSAG